jgi:beta-phosphoglucomutase-like phosphatase (HAD superfamily)
LCSITFHIRKLFGAIVSAEDVTTSKPHPETFLKAASLLNVSPEECIVFEDAPKGVEAAENAGMKAVVLTTMHEPEEFTRYNNIVAFVKDYTDPYFKPLLQNS